MSFKITTPLSLVGGAGLEAGGNTGSVERRGEHLLAELRSRWLTIEE